MTDYPAGTRLRVAFVGTVDSYGDVHIAGGFRLLPGDLELVERVEVIEPEWQPGDVVLDANGDVYRRLAIDASPWESWNSFLAESDPARPLTLLARDGKAVPPQVAGQTEGPGH
jgi:hypothetical protein